jgi:hypothetical protein
VDRQVGGSVRTQQFLDVAHLRASLARVQLETLCESISATARMYLIDAEEAVRIARTLPMVLAQCDD